jgi:hypothetical protein
MEYPPKCRLAQDGWQFVYRYAISVQKMQQKRGEDPAGIFTGNAARRGTREEN